MASVTTSLYVWAFLIWHWISAHLNSFCPTTFVSYTPSLLDHMLKEGNCRGCEELANSPPRSATSLLCWGFFIESRGGLIFWKYLAAAFYCSLLSRNYRGHCITGVPSTFRLVCIFSSRTSSPKAVLTLPVRWQSVVKRLLRSAGARSQVSLFRNNLVLATPKEKQLCLVENV